MSWRRELVGLLLVVACVACVACNESPPPPAVKHDDAAVGPRKLELATTPSQVVMAEPTIVLPSVEAFQLLSPGAAPRTPLRYHLTSGTTTYVHRVELSDRQTDAKGALSDPVKIPEIRTLLRVTAGDGPLKLHMLPAEAAATTPVTAAAMAVWGALANRDATVALDDRGQLGPLQLTDDPDHKHSATERDELIGRLIVETVPLPAEPIGTGATWRVITIFKLGPATVKQTANFTLTAPGKIHVASRVVGEEQRLSAPEIPSDTAVEMLALVRKLEGDVTLDLQKPLIGSGKLTMSHLMHLRITRAGHTTERIRESTGTLVLETK